MSQDKKVIFKLIADYPPLQAFFRKYVNLFNQLFQQNSSPAYVELIYDGVLWIIESIPYYQKMIDQFREIKNKIPVSPTIRAELRHELTSTFYFQETPLEVQLELISHTSSVLFPILQSYFQIINPQIQLTVKNTIQIRVQFPNLDALIDYLIPLYARV